MITFSGLASGLDTASIIDQIIAAERAPAGTLQVRQAGLNSQKTKVGELSGMLKALETATRDIDTIGELRAAKGSSSDENRIGVAVSSIAQPGSYAVRVGSLANAQSNASAAFASADPGDVGDGSLDITVGADAPITVAWTSAESIHDIASSINASEARVNATVLYDGSNYRLMVTAEESGVANAVSFAETGSPLGLAQAGSELVAASDAQFTLNGLAISSATNVIDDALTGVTFTLETLHEAGEPDALIDIERDAEAQREVVGAFVDAYNEIADFLDSELSYNGETRGSDTLFGDSTIRSLQSALRESLISGYSSGGEDISLGRLGISLEDGGRLAIDDATLAAADLEELENLFLGEAGGAGLLSRLGDTVTLYTRVGDGLLEGKEDGLQSRIDDYDDQIIRIEENAARVGEQLARQFAQLEIAMAGLQAQSNQLLAILGQG